MSWVWTKHLSYYSPLQIQQENNDIKNAAFHEIEISSPCNNITSLRVGILMPSFQLLGNLLFARSVNTFYLQKLCVI